MLVEDDNYLRHTTRQANCILLIYIHSHTAYEVLQEMDD